MKSETGYDTLPRTRSTWLTLAGAGLLWVGACVWAFSAVGFDAGAEIFDDGQQPAQPQEQTRLVQTDAEETARLDAQAAAAERRRIAAAEEAEMALLKESELAEQKLKRAAAAKELARQETLIKEARAAEEEASEKAAEKAAEKAKLAAQATAQAREAEQKRVREQEAERQRVALASQSAQVAEEARRAAAAEASRIATLARQQRNYARGRDRELDVLVGLSSRLRFAPGSATVSRQTERILDDIFNPLYLYSEASIVVSVATNEYDGAINDGLLSRDRGRAIASYLINRGLEKERFRIHIESGEELSAGTHRVRVSAEEVRK